MTLMPDWGAKERLAAFCELKRLNREKKFERIHAMQEMCPIR